MGDAMEDSVRMFLDEHRTTSRWLDDIIDVLLKMRGSAHVNAIARELSKSYRRDIDTVEQTVTRRINDFCSDAADFRKPKKYDLFERIEPATYRLRAYPTKPNIIELIRIEFDDATMQDMWRLFSDLAHKKDQEKWKAANNERKLAAYVKWMSRENIYTMYKRRKAEEPMLGEIDISELQKRR
jgi:hypothetical protein